MTPFDYDRAVRRIWSNVRRRYLRFARRMQDRKEAGLSHTNVVSIDQWLVGKTVEETYLNKDYKGNRAAVRQRLAARALPSPAELVARGANPERLHAELAAYISKRLGVDLELKRAISYSGESDGQTDKDTKRFVKKPQKREWR